MANQICFDQATKLFENLTCRQIGEGFAYRGHGKSYYKLVPSFQREGAMENFLSLEDASTLIASTWPFRIFYQTANQVGLSLPSVTYKKHQNYISESEIDAILNFTDEMESDYDDDDLEIMAFAQHYQVPTPLLDWTRSPLVAMYFAASGAMHHIVSTIKKHTTIDEVWDNQVPATTRQTIIHEVNKNSLSVWQADTIALNEVSRQRHSMGSAAETAYSIRFFTPRTQGNRNIVAQQGLFSVHFPRKMTADYRYRDIEPKCLSDVVQEHVSWLDEGKGESIFIAEARSKGFLNELILPYSQVANLLKILGSCGIHAASIYPDHQGCAKRVQELAYISIIKRFFLIT